MDADAFRGDRYLRASAYHLLGWAIVGLGLTLPFYLSIFDQVWPTPWQWFYRITLVGAGVIWSFVSERRALKIAGPATAPPRRGGVRLGAALLTLSALASVVLLAVGAAKYMVALWLLAGAAVLAALGWPMVPLYAASAAALAACGLVALALAALVPGAQTPPSVVLVWSAVLAVVVIPCAVAVARHYLWRFD